MNRLLITILLVLAFAISFATLAHAQDATTQAAPAAAAPPVAPPPTTAPKTTKHVGHKIAKPADSTANTDSTTAPAAAAAPADTAPATTTNQIKNVSDICQGDKDCGRATVDLGGDKESRLTAMKVDDDYVEVTQVCPHCDGVVGYQPVRMKIDPSKTREDLRRGLDDIMKEASSQIKGLSKLQDELNSRIASCDITDKSSIIWKNGKPHLDAKSFKVDDDDKVDPDEDFSNADHRVASVKSKQEECYENVLTNDADSADPDKKKAVKTVMAAYENRLSALSQKAALGLLSENELEEYSRFSKFQTGTILSKDNPILNKLASNFWKTKMLGTQNQPGELGNMQANLNQLLGIDPKNSSALWGALSNPSLSKAALKGYSADVQLAVAATGAAANRGEAYNTTAQQMLAWQTSPNTMQNEVNHLSSEVPSKIKATSVAYASDPLQAQINAAAANAKDDSTDGDFANNLAIIKKRIANDMKGFGEEGLTAIVAQNGPNLGTVNSNRSNLSAHFAVGSFGSGQAQLPNNPNSTFSNNNSWANNVTSQNNFGNNFQTNSFPGNNFQSSGFTGTNFANNYQSGFGNTGFGNTGFGNTGFGNSGFSGNTFTSNTNTGSNFNVNGFRSAH